MGAKYSYPSESPFYVKSQRRSNTIEIVRKYLTIDDIQKEFLPISKKKIRTLVKKYLPVKCIGGRIYVERAALENLLSDPDREFFSLK